MKRLHRLVLKGTATTESGIAELKKALPNVAVSR